MRCLTIAIIQVKLMNHVHSFIRYNVIYCMIIRYITVKIDWLFNQLMVTLVVYMTANTLKSVNNR